MRSRSAFGFLLCTASTSRTSFSPSSAVIWPRRTMYCTRSRALSTANPAIPAAAFIISRIAPVTLVLASWLMALALAASSGISDGEDCGVSAIEARRVLYGAEKVGPEGGWVEGCVGGWVDGCVGGRVDGC